MTFVMGPRLFLSWFAFQETHRIRISICSTALNIMEDTIMKTKYPGVRIRRNSIVIDFRYRGVRCRETLHLAPTKNNLAYAHNLRATILLEIAQDRFDYANHFPDSPKIPQFSTNNTPHRLISTLLTTWLKLVKSQVAHSTWNLYRQTIDCHLIPEFGDIPASELTTERVKHWMHDLHERGLNPKTINNILTPLRQALADAYADGIIDRNPMDRIKNLKYRSREPDPFSFKEIQAILSHLTGQSRNLFQYAFWSGLRTSELIALRWEDVDFINGYVWVRRAKVQGRIKEPKTAAGRRRVKILPPAHEALESQKAYSHAKGAEVFLNPRTGEPWVSDKAIREVDWERALRKAGVRPRAPYQTRHTYASMLLTAGENPMWVAQQMGHENMYVTLKRYARWLPAADPDAGRLVTEWARKHLEF